MKTTIEISEALFAEARRVAQRDRTTLRALIEEGLRQVLRRREEPRTFKLRDGRFKGDGLHPEFADGSWDRLRDAIYEGRGA